MAKWLPLPAETFYSQEDQLRFINDRRRRICKTCKQEYSVIPPVVVCPTCGFKGQRVFDRMTILAGRRWGKSRVGSIAGVDEAGIPHSIGWACAPTNPKLHRYVIPAFRQLIPEEWVADWNSEHLDLLLKNGSLIHFQTLEDPDQGRGQGLDWLWIDEVSELTKHHWEVIRPSLAGDTIAFFTTSPRGYDWVYDELYEPALKKIPGYWACHAKSSESMNPKLTEDFLAREKSQMSDTMYRQEYEADFVIFTGAVYGGLVDPQILRSDDEVRKIIPEWPQIASWRQVIIGIDTGADHPFGAVKIVSTEMGLVACGEYLERDKTFAQHSSNILSLANHSNVRFAINKNERQQSLELAQHSIYCEKAENDQVSGIERVKSWLQQGQLYLVASGCPQLIRQLKSYRWAENYTPKTEEKRTKEKVYKKDDELPDCLRYAVMIWPMLPKPREAIVEKRDLSKLPGEMKASIERMRRIDGRGPGDEKESKTLDFWS